MKDLAQNQRVWTVGSWVEWETLWTLPTSLEVL